LFVYRKPAIPKNLMIKSMSIPMFFYPSLPRIKFRYIMHDLKLDLVTTLLLAKKSMTNIGCIVENLFGAWNVHNCDCSSVFGFFRCSRLPSFINFPKSGRNISRPSITLPYVIPPILLIGLKTEGSIRF
jgi:hypothetical protein